MTTLLASGCAPEAVTGAGALQAAQGNAGQVSGGFDAVQKSKERLEANAYSARIVAEHESMLAGGMEHHGVWLEAGARRSLTP